MLDHTDGIILKTTRYGESGLIAKVFTRKHGLMSLMAKGVRSSRNKQKGNLLQPLNILHLEIYLKEQRQLHLLKSYHATYIFQTLHHDFIRQSVAVFCLELTLKCLREQETNERLYDYLLDFLTQLDISTDSAENKPLYFMLEVAGLLGFEPSLHHISEATYFNLESGRFENEVPAGGNVLNPHETGIFKKFLAMYYEKNDLKLTHAERKLLLDKLILYFRWHVTDFTGLKSPEIWGELLR